MGAGLLDAGGGEVRSFTVREESVSFTAPAEGLVLREERALYSDSAYLLVTAAEGERLPGGAAAALEFTDGEAYARALLSAPGEAPDDAGEAVLELARARYGAAGSPAGAAERLLGLLQGGPGGGFAAEGGGPPEARGPSGGGTEGTAVTVDEPGLFTSHTDGFTGLGAEDCAQPGRLAELLTYRPQRPEGAFGALVTGVRWYFAALLDEEPATRLSPGERAELSFAQGRFEARVESVSRPEGGSCAVVFSCAEGLADMLTVRAASAEMLVRRAEGLYVPAEAVYERGGRYFVQALVLGEAVEREIEPLCEYKEGYLVEPGALHDGSEVLAVQAYGEEDAGGPRGRPNI